MGHKTKLIKKTKLPNKKHIKIFFLCGPHLHARGPQNFLSRATFHSKKLRARGPQFADPWSRTSISDFNTVLSRKTGKSVILGVKISFLGWDLDFFAKF